MWFPGWSPLVDSVVDKCLVWRVNTEKKSFEPLRMSVLPFLNHLGIPPQNNAVLVIIMCIFAFCDDICLLSEREDELQS
jgi:hypothetical protein